MRQGVIQQFLAVAAVSALMVLGCGSVAIANDLDGSGTEQSAIAQEATHPTQNSPADGESIADSPADTDVDKGGAAQGTAKPPADVTDAETAPSTDETVPGDDETVPGEDGTRPGNQGTTPAPSDEGATSGAIEAPVESPRQAPADSGKQDESAPSATDTATADSATSGMVAEADANTPSEQPADAVTEQAPSVTPAATVMPSGVSRDRGECAWHISFSNKGEVGVYYLLSWVSADGTVAGSGVLNTASDSIRIPAWEAHRLTVTAMAKAGYTLQGNTKWSSQLPAHSGCLPVIEPLVPQITSENGCTGSTYSIPTMDGVRYEVTSGPSGGFLLPGESVTIRATALAGYVFPGNATILEWNLTAVEWDNCDEPQITMVAPVVPQVVHAVRDCLTGDVSAATITLTPITGIRYLVSGSGAFSGADPNVWIASDLTTEVTIAVEVTDTALFELDPGVALLWPQTVKWRELNVCTADEVVTPVPVTWTQATCEEPNGSYTVPSQTGVSYWIGTDSVAAGSHALGDTAIQVLADADPGYAFPIGAEDSWQIPALVPPAGCDDPAPDPVDPPPLTDPVDPPPLTDPVDPPPLTDPVDWDASGHLLPMDAMTSATAVTAHPSATTARTTSLAATGSDVAVMALAALAMVGVGAGVMLARRLRS